MKYKAYLQEKVLPFWLKNSIDHENGGIFTMLDEAGEVYGTEKSVWFQGRALWTFSKAYNCIEKRQEYLDAAEKIFSFLPRCTDTDGRMFFKVTATGEYIQKRRYFFSESFAAIGCAEYFKATGNREAWRLAETYFETMYAVYSDPAMSVPKFNPKTADFKALSPVMILMSTAQIMRSVGENAEKYDKIVTAAVEEIIRGGFLNEENRALLESVTTSGQFSDTPTGRVVNPGHSLEAAWFILSEGIMKKDDELKAIGKHIIDITMDKGIDMVNGGVLSFIDIKGRPQQQLEWDMKLWWPHNEAIIANGLAYYLFHEKQYAENRKELEEYSFSHFADQKNSEWYGYLHYDGTVANTLKGNIFKGPFHLPRMLMLLACLEEGNPERFFA